MTQMPAHPTEGPGHTDELDPANQMVAEALRKSFRVLKLIMFVLVVLYFLSGWFSVKPNEAGVVLRYGRIVGAGEQETREAVLGPGWHWSWPYPIDRWETVSTSERELPVQFMFELSDEEQTGGIKGYKYGTLSPTRDDYLVTGDVNILHASLVVKYRITDPVAYLTHVHPAPDPRATPRSKPYTRYPEYTLMTDLVRNAVIETAAERNDVTIRGVRQSEFLAAVGSRVNQKLKDLEMAGTPLGIRLDPATGVLAPKTGGIEGILPPRQVQEAFENVDKALSQKVVAITKASAEAQSLFVRTAGLGYEALAEAIQREFDLIRQALAATTGSVEETTLAAELAEQRKKVEALLTDAAGDVRNVVKQAEIKRDQIIKEAAGDYHQFMAVLPEYERNPDIFLQQFLAETFAACLSNEKIAKIFLPADTGRGVWLPIPRGSLSAEGRPETKEDKPGVIREDTSVRTKLQ